MTPLSFSRVLALATIAGLVNPAPARAADPIDIAVHPGLPRVGTVAGVAATWRNVTMRAQTDDFTVEVVGRTCVDVVVPGSPVRMASAAEACNDSLAPELRRSLRVAATWKAPALPGAGTMIDVSLRTLRIAGHEEFDPRTRVGVDVAIVQPVGPLDLVAGAGAPFGAAHQSSAYAGVTLGLPGAGVIEVGGDVSRLDAGAGLDRSLGVRWRLGGRHGLRLSAGVQRLLDDPYEHWRADIGAEWRF